MFSQVTNKSAGRDTSSAVKPYVKNTNFERQDTKATSGEGVSELDSLFMSLDTPRNQKNLRRITKGSDDTSYRLTQSTSAKLQVMTTDKAGIEELGLTATKSVRSAGISIKNPLKSSNNCGETAPFTYSNTEIDDLCGFLKPNSRGHTKATKSYKMSFSEETASKDRSSTESVQSSEEEKPWLPNEFYNLSEMSSEMDARSSCTENYFRMDRNSDVMSICGSNTSSEQS